MPPQRAIHAPREAEIRETDQLELCLRDGSGELMQGLGITRAGGGGGAFWRPGAPTADAQPIVNGDSAFLPHFYHHSTCSASMYGSSSPSLDMDDSPVSSPRGSVAGSTRRDSASVYSVLDSPPPTKVRGVKTFGFNLRC